MPVTQIVTIAECLTYLGKGSNATDAELGLLNMLRRQAEASVRRYFKTGVVQTTYTNVILPPADAYSMLQPISASRLSSGGSQILRLPDYPIRSVTTLFEDENALGGAATGSFPASSELTEGNDFYIAVDQTGLGKMGHLIRYNYTWPRQPGSIKITYVAGWSADELAGNVSNPYLDVADIKIGTLKVVAEAFNEARNQQSGQTGSSGPVKSERLDDWAVTYDTTHAGAAVDIPVDAKKIFDRYIRKVVG